MSSKACFPLSIIVLMLDRRIIPADFVLVSSNVLSISKSKGWVNKVVVKQIFTSPLKSGPSEDQRTTLLNRVYLTKKLFLL